MNTYSTAYRIKNRYRKDIRQEVEANSLRYHEPADSWIDGHPLGNGDLGIMVMGSPVRFKLYFGKSDIWDNRTVNGNKSVFPEEKYRELVDIVERGDVELFNRINKKSISDYSRTNYPSPQSCGVLEMAFAKPSYERYLQVLDLFTGEDRIGWQRKDGTYHITCHVNQKCNISECCIDFIDQDTNEIEISLGRTPTDLYKKEEPFEQGNYVGFEFVFPDGLRYANLLYVDAENVQPVKDSTLKVPARSSGRIRIIQTIVTSYETGKPREAAVERLDAHRERDKDELKRESRAFWEDFWNRSYIELDSKKVQQIWYLGLYLIGSCSRKGATAPGLQGIWIEGYNPAWKADYHTDLNIEMNYWPVYTANRLELAEPYYRLYTDLIPQFKEDTRSYFEAQGIRVPIAHCNKGYDLAGYLGGLFWQGSSAWVASLFQKNYAYSQDKDFLEKTAYPFVSECINFYNSMLRKTENGTYTVYLSWSPEEMEADQIKAIDNNPTIDLSLIKNLYRFFLEMVNVLDLEGKAGVDVQQAKDIYENLSEYPQDDGHLRESEHHDFDYCHRHLSVNTPTYPMGELNGYSSSKEQFSLGLNTFHKYLKRGNAERRMYFSGTYTWLSCVAATLGLGDFANLFLSDYMDAFLNRNMMNSCLDYQKKGRGICVDDTQDFSAGTEYEFAERVFEIETSTCAVEAINLMLLQSFGGKLSVFPAYPWKNGSFEGLRGEGGFLVSSRLVDGRIESLFVESLFGTPCELYLDKRIRSVTVLDITRGKQIKLEGLPNNDIGNKLTCNFETEPGHEYRIAVAY